LRITRTSGSVMFARGSVLLRFVRRSSPGRRPPRLPAAAAASQASCLARCASRRAWSSAASRSRAGGQPLPPFGPPGQGPRRHRPRVAAVLGGVGRGRLGEQLLDLRQRPVRLLRRVAGQLRPIQAEQTQRYHALGGQQPQHLAEQPAQRHLMPRPEPRDGRMIGMQPAGDHPVAHVPHAPLFDHPAGPLTLAVAIQQQRHHHLRVERRPAVPAGPAGPAELAPVQGGHRVQHHEHQIVFGQPVAHVHRQQQRLITLRKKEVLRHTLGSQAPSPAPHRRAVYAAG
jgi:hypothetical protein